MTASFDPTPGPDDRPHAAATAPCPPARPSRSGRVLRWWLGLSVIALCACLVGALLLFNHLDLASLNVVINGDDIGDGITIGGHAVAAAGALVLALLLVMLVVLLIPLLLLLVMGVVALALVCGLGVPMVALALALAVVTSPVWVLALPIWLIARRPASRRVSGSATMAA